MSPGYVVLCKSIPLQNMMRADRSMELPSSMIGQVGALLAKPLLCHQAAALLHLVTLPCVALDDICHAMPAEGHHIVQLLAPSCLHAGPGLQRELIDQTHGTGTRHSSQTPQAGSQGFSFTHAGLLGQLTC